MTKQGICLICGERFEREPDTQLYKQAGNAVTVNVIQKLGEEIEVSFGETDNV